MQHSVPYTPQQNGVVERKNRAMKEMATCMLEAKYLYPKLWTEAINYDAYVHNKVAYKYLEYMATFEAWKGHKPDVSHLKVFGSSAWARIPFKKREALEPKRKESIMVLYAKYAKGYKLFNPSYQNTFIERSVQFEEEPMQEGN